MHVVLYTGETLSPTREDWRCADRPECTVDEYVKVGHHRLVVDVVVVVVGVDVVVVHACFWLL